MRLGTGSFVGNKYISTRRGTVGGERHEYTRLWIGPHIRISQLNVPKEVQEMIYS